MIVELEGSKDTTEILQKLTKCYPVPSNEKEEGVHELLGPTNTRLIQVLYSVLY